MSEDRTHQQPLCVPVRDNACGFTLRLFRTRDGARCAVAFTTPEQVTSLLGAQQRWLHLAEDALRELLGPLGVDTVVVDPSLVAPPVRTGPELPARPQPQLLGASAGAGAGVAGLSVRPLA